MDFQGICDRLRALGAPGLVGTDEPRGPDPKNKKDKGRTGESFVLVEPDQLVPFLMLCRDDPRLGFEILADISATDPAADDEHLWVGVQLLSVAHKQRLAIKCIVPKARAVLPSTVPVYRASQYHERECSEMFGITFSGHPDPRHVLLPDDWIGFPMRKDYEYPKEYHGISCE